jgi:hypothetical protein
MDVLKGNFKTRQPVVADENKEDLNSQFEREALKRLGGSIAFVSKKKFLFGMNADADSTPAETNRSDSVTSEL